MSRTWRLTVQGNNVAYRYVGRGWKNNENTEKFVARHMKHNAALEADNILTGEQVLTPKGVILMGSERIYLKDIERTVKKTGRKMLTHGWAAIEEIQAIAAFRAGVKSRGWVDPDPQKRRRVIVRRYCTNKIATALSECNVVVFIGTMSTAALLVQQRMAEKSRVEIHIPTNFFHVTKQQGYVKDFVLLHNDTKYAIISPFKKMYNGTEAALGVGVKDKIVSPYRVIRHVSGEYTVEKLELHDPDEEIRRIFVDNGIHMLSLEKWTTEEYANG